MGNTPIQIQDLDSIDREIFSYNVSQAEFFMIHATIDRIVELSQSNKLMVTPSQIRTLKIIRKKPTYLTISHRNSIIAILNSVILRNREKRGQLYEALSYKSKAIIPRKKQSS